jgi:hypothetical protein
LIGCCVRLGLLFVNYLNIKDAEHTN